jgi:hypothetical protein
MSENEDQSSKQTQGSGEGAGWARNGVVFTAVSALTAAVSAAAAVASAFLSYNTSQNAENAARAAAVSAATSQELFQGSAACRAIRTEILELHQAGLTGKQIKAVLSAEQTSDSYYQKNPTQGVLAEDNSECGRRLEGGRHARTVQTWIDIISAQPVPAKKGG